jgi:hypothetical protein
MESQKEAVISEELFSVGRRIRKMKHLLCFFFVHYHFVEGLKDDTLSVHTTACQIYVTCN